MGVWQPAKINSPQLSGLVARELQDLEVSLSP